MATSSRVRRSTCPISYGLDFLGDRWTLLVIRDLALSGKRHFREFATSPEGIATNVLTERLKMLVEAGIVERRADPGHARQVIYELTPKGEDLIPLLVELGYWGARYDRETSVPRRYIQRIEQDRDGLVADIRAALQARRSRG